MAEERPENPSSVAADPAESVPHPESAPVPAAAAAAASEASSAATTTTTPTKEEVASFSKISPSRKRSPKSGSRTGSPKSAVDVDASDSELAPLQDDSAVELEPDDTEDDFDSVLDDGDSAIGSTHSSTMSFREEMIRQRKEHGREYQGYMEAKYVLPMDEQETERLDFQCHLVWLTLDRKHGFAPIESPQRALDVGCGTGIWAIQYADAHPGTEVLGVDLAAVQPESTPPNLRFEVDDLEQPWNFTNKFDYIHCQLMIGAFSDWPKFFEQSYEFLDTDGYLEVHDIDFVIRCDDNTMPEDSSLVKWHKEMHGAAKAAGFPLDAISHVPEMMKQAGYVDIVAQPIKWPINTWPKDPKHKELGMWANENFSWGCESMSLALFTRALGWSAEQVRVFMISVRNDLKNKKIHAYWNFWVVYGRKASA